MFCLSVKKRKILLSIIGLFFVGLAVETLATDDLERSHVRVIRAREDVGYGGGYVGLALAFETHQNKKNWGAIVAFHPRKEKAGKDWLFETRYYDSCVTVEYFSEGIDNFIDITTNHFVFKRINRTREIAISQEIDGVIVKIKKKVDCLDPNLGWPKRYLFEWKLNDLLWPNDLKKKIESLTYFRTKEFFRYTAAGYCYGEDVDNCATFCMRLLDTLKIPVLKSQFIKFFLERDYRKIGFFQRQNIFAPYYTSAWPLCICAEISLIQDNLSDGGTRVLEENLKIFFGDVKWTEEKQKHKDPNKIFIHSML
jgi:hypothetical protein